MVVEVRVRRMRMRHVEMGRHVSKDTCKFLTAAWSSLRRAFDEDDHGRRIVDSDSTRKTVLYREVNATTQAMLEQFATDRAAASSASAATSAATGGSR